MEGELLFSILQEEMAQCWQLQFPKVWMEQGSLKLALIAVLSYLLALAGDDVVLDTLPVHGGHPGLVVVLDSD